jgi:hypothetical protein
MKKSFILLLTVISMFIVFNGCKHSSNNTPSITDEGLTVDYKSDSARRAIAVTPTSGITGGGVLVYVRGPDTPDGAGDTIPVEIVDGKAHFDTVPGTEYIVFLDFYLFVGEKVITGSEIFTNFIAADSDIIEFYILPDELKAGISANGVALDIYAESKDKTPEQTPESIEAIRVEKLASLGGSDKVAEFNFE